MATGEWLARIAEMNILADPDRLSRLDLSAVER
jgi:hypothetical protein